MFIFQIGNCQNKENVSNVPKICKVPKIEYQLSDVMLSRPTGVKGWLSRCPELNPKFGVAAYYSWSKFCFKSHLLDDTYVKKRIFKHTQINRSAIHRRQDRHYMRCATSDPDE